VQNTLMETAGPAAPIATVLCDRCSTRPSAVTLGKNGRSFKLCRACLAEEVHGVLVEETTKKIELQKAVQAAALRAMRAPCIRCAKQSTVTVKDPLPYPKGLGGASFCDPCLKAALDEDEQRHGRAVPPPPAPCCKCGNDSERTIEDPTGGLTGEWCDPCARRAVRAELVLQAVKDAGSDAVERARLIMAATDFVALMFGHKKRKVN
jgi:hypothetical protein